MILLWNLIRVKYDLKPYKQQMETDHLRSAYRTKSSLENKNVVASSKECGLFSLEERKLSRVVQYTKSSYKETGDQLLSISTWERKIRNHATFQQKRLKKSCQR